MNRLADALVPYLDRLGIAYNRNTPEMTARTSIQQANATPPYDLYLALHSNASPEQFAGMLRGPDIYYNPADPESRRAADNSFDDVNYRIRSIEARNAHYRKACCRCRQSAYGSRIQGMSV